MSDRRNQPTLSSPCTPFDKLTPIHPNRRITLETGLAPLAPRLIDLFAPLGFGQRALVVAPPQAGKTTILRQIAAAILKNYPEASLFLCLVDERPEEVTEWRTEIQGPALNGLAMFVARIILHETQSTDKRQVVELRQGDVKARNAPSPRL